MTRAVFQATVANDAGDIQPGAQIDVLDEVTGTVPSSGIWESRTGGTGLSNPFFADSNGFFQFYVDSGRYRVTATGTSGSQTWRNEDLIASEDTLTSIQSYTATYAANVYTVTPFGGVFAPLSSGLVIEFDLPVSATTAQAQINYNGIIDNLNWIDDSATVSGDIDSTYNKRIRCKFNGTNWLIVSDISGSNANGDWIRWASGFQRCIITRDATLTINSPNGSVFFVNSGTWTYSKTFPMVPNITEECIDGAGGLTWFASSTALTTTTISHTSRLISPVARTSSIFKLVQSATGRWY